MNRIEYRVVSAKKLDEELVEVVVEIVMEKMFNGYGGGRLTITGHRSSMYERIAELVRWKLFGAGAMINAPVTEFNIDQDTSLLDELLYEPPVESPIPPAAPPSLPNESHPSDAESLAPVIEGAVVEPSHPE